MDRREFLNTAGTVALGSVTGAAVGGTVIGAIIAPSPTHAATTVDATPKAVDASGQETAAHIHLYTYNGGTTCWCGEHRPVSLGESDEKALEALRNRDWTRAAEIFRSQLHVIGRP